MKRRTLLLDLDGTLVDSVPDLMASVNRLMVRQVLPTFTAPEITAMVGDGAAALVRRAMAARDRTMTPEDLDTFLADYTLHAAVETCCFPRVPDTLERLRQDGWRLGVCTNKPELAARQVLNSLGLLDSFVAVAGGDTPARKPDPAHLLNLLTVMGAEPEDAVMVGDHHNDVLAARGAGLPCIFAAWGYGNLSMAEGTAAVAERFDELPALLDALG